jgi:hypothetical protein
MNTVIENSTKLKYATVNIKNCIFDETNRPVKLITTKNIEYSFPKLISTNRIILIQLKNFLSPKNKVIIIYDNKNRLHKMGNIVFNWDETSKYKLMILSWTKGLLFNDYIEVSAFENVEKFYKNYDYDKFFNEGSEITIIIKDLLPVNIPLEY